MRNSRFLILVYIFLVNALAYLFMIDEEVYSPQDLVWHAPDYVTESLLGDAVTPSTPPANRTNVVPNGNQIVSTLPNAPYTYGKAISDYDSRISHFLSRHWKASGNRILRGILRLYIRTGFVEEDIAA